MTVSTLTTRWEYDGDGANRFFGYGNRIFAASDLQVHVDGERVTAGYSVTGVGNAEGGNVVFETAPAAGTKNVIVVSAIPSIQQTAYPEGGPFPAASHEAALDRFARLGQQNAKAVQRALHPPAADPDSISCEIPAAASRASKLLGFDGTGAPVAVDGADASSTSVTATGSTTGRLLAVRFADWVDVRDFGVDGAGDDTEGLQAALLAATALRRAVRVPYGTYTLTDQIDIPAGCRLLCDAATFAFSLDGSMDNGKVCFDVDGDGVQIVGARIVPTVSGAPADARTGTPVRIGSGTTGRRHVLLEDIEIDGSAMPDNGNGIAIEGPSRRIALRRIAIDGGGQIGRGVIVHWGGDGDVPTATYHPGQVTIDGLAMTDSSDDGDAAVVYCSGAFGVTARALVGTDVKRLLLNYAGDYGADLAEADVAPLVGRGIVVDGFAGAGLESGFKVDGRPGISGDDLDCPLVARGGTLRGAGVDHATIQGLGVELNTCKGAVIEGVDIGGFYYYGVGLGPRVEDLRLAGLRIHDTGYQGMRLADGTTAPRGVAVDGCRLWACGGGAEAADVDLSGIYVGDAAEDVAVRDCRFGAAGETMLYGISLGAAVRVRLAGNHVAALASGGVAYVRSSTGWAEALALRCTFEGNSAAAGITLDQGAPPVRLGIGGRVESFGTAAPDAGTWARGDVVWNTAPAAAGPPGWVCTTGGTPGTWKAMADLAA